MPEPEEGKAKDPCHHLACKLQDCMVKANYEEARCRHVLGWIEECCRKTFAQGRLVPTCEGFQRLREPEGATKTDTSKP